MSQLKEFSEQMSLWLQSRNVWKAIQKSGVSETEQLAIARSVSLNIIQRYCNEYENSFYAQVKALYPHRAFGVYIIEHTPVPAFAGRRSKRRTKAVLGWLYAFLSVTGHMELLHRFEAQIHSYVQQNL